MKTTTTNTAVLDARRQQAAETLDAPEAIFGGYAESLIHNPALYDRLEVHGVRDLAGEFGYPSKAEGTACEVDDDDPQFFSVYVHLVDGGVECIGDFATIHEATAYGVRIGQQYGWALDVYGPNGQQITSTSHLAQRKDHPCCHGQQNGFGLRYHTPGCINADDPKEEDSPDDDQQTAQPPQPGSLMLALMTMATHYAALRIAAMYR